MSDFLYRWMMENPDNAKMVAKELMAMNDKEILDSAIDCGALIKKHTQPKMKFYIQQEYRNSTEDRAINKATLISDDIGIVSAYGDGVTPVGSVEFCREIYRKYERTISSGVIPSLNTYPKCLHQFMHRDFLEGTLGDAASWDFVKPLYCTKAFTGGIYKDVDLGNIANYLFPVWRCEPVSFQSEVRYYFLGARLIGSGRYDSLEEHAPIPDEAIVCTAGKILFDTIGIKAFALDFGVLDNGKTALVEFNDAWATGYYKGSLTERNYAIWLATRWEQIVKVGF